MSRISWGILGNGKIAQIFGRALAGSKNRRLGAVASRSPHRGGAVGEIQLIEAVFGYDAGPKPENYLLVHELAGGGILDVGCYTTSMTRLIAGVAVGRDFAEPTHVKGAAYIGPSTRVDHYAVASLAFSTGVVASLACGVQVD